MRDIMDVGEERYRKIINTYRPLINNVISEYPIPLQAQLPLTRNFKYLVEKEKYSNHLPSQFYDDAHDEIKAMMNDSTPEARLLALRLIRCLPFTQRVKLIEEGQNEFTMFMNRMETQSAPQVNISPDKKTQGEKKPTAMVGMGGSSTVISSQFHYEAIADMTDLLLSVYELTSLSEEIYFDVNQKITSIFSRLFENCLSSTNRDIVRNSFESLRALTLTFGTHSARAAFSEAEQSMESSTYLQEAPFVDTLTPINKLISKVISIFNKQQNYEMSAMTTSSSSSYSSNPVIRQLLLKTREYQVRVRCRMLTGVAILLTHIPEHLPQLYDLLIKQIFIIMANANEFDINLECFFGIKAVLSLPLSQPTRNYVLKNWAESLIEISHSYKKQYFQFFVSLLHHIANYPHCPIKLKYLIATSYLPLTSLISHQQSRLIIYRLACRSVIELINKCNNNVINSFFHFPWFINRIKDDSELFRSEFLICLLHQYFANPQAINENKLQIKDLLSLSHSLLDWQCSSKEETHIPTIKFAFDMYLQFLKQAAMILGSEIEKYVLELIERCNEPKMYVLFKFKLIATFIRLECYSKSLLTYSETKLDLSFLEGEVLIFMMPKNPKPIFDYEYSLTADGEIESRKEIQTIKVIMDLLAAIEEVHQEKQEEVNTIIIKYHQYLADLEVQQGSNCDLINCLQSLEADNYFTECQRNFLLSLIDSPTIEYTLDGRVTSSPMEVYNCDQEYNIFGGMSPVHLKIRILGGRSFTSVYIEIKKNQWVTVPEMKLVISSAMEVKEIPFESCIVEIKVDRIGLINFEAWTTEGTALMLGSGSHRINRIFKWLKVDHFRIIDGIRSKAFLGANISMDEMDENGHSKKADATYLTFCYGEPVLVQILYSRNEIVVTITNKEIWNQIQEFIAGMLEELTDGTAELICYQR